MRVGVILESGVLPVGPMLPIQRWPYRVQVLGGGQVFSNEGFADARVANQRVMALLSRTSAWPATVIRVVGSDGFLFGQWIWSNGGWCHQGGTWKSGVPNCTGVTPPVPSYPPAGPYLGTPPKLRYGRWR